MKTLFINISDKEIVVGNDAIVLKPSNGTLVNNFYYALGEEITRGLRTKVNKTNLIRQFVEERPQEAQALLNQWEDIKMQLFGEHVDGQVYVTLPDVYLQWLRQNTNQDYCEIYDSKFQGQSHSQILFDVDFFYKDSVGGLVKDARRFISNNNDIEELVVSENYVTRNSHFVLDILKEISEVEKRGIVFIPYEKWQHNGGEPDNPETRNEEKYVFLTFERNIDGNDSQMVLFDCDGNNVGGPIMVPNMYDTPSCEIRIKKNGHTIAQVAKDPFDDSEDYYVISVNGIRNSDHYIFIVDYMGPERFFELVESNEEYNYDIVDNETERIIAHDCSEPWEISKTWWACRFHESGEAPTRRRLINKETTFLLDEEELVMSYGDCRIGPEKGCDFTECVSDNRIITTDASLSLIRIRNQQGEIINENRTRFGDFSFKRPYQYGKALVVGNALGQNPDLNYIDLNGFMHQIHVKLELSEYEANIDCCMVSPNRLIIRPSEEDANIYLIDVHTGNILHHCTSYDQTWNDLYTYQPYAPLFENKYLVCQFDDGKKGVIDINGNEVLSAKFDSIYIIH